MPRAYRTMKAVGVPPRPVVGDSATRLGVRERDLEPDRDGNVRPGRGGMSMVSSIAGLRRRVAKLVFSPSMVPQRLNDLGRVPGAMGSNALRVFRIGEGSFERGAYRAVDAGSESRRPRHRTAHIVDALLRLQTSDLQHAGLLG